MMDCQKASALLFEYIDQTLSAEQAKELREHVSACRACARELEISEGLDRQLAAHLSVSSTPDLWPEVQRRIAMRSSPSTHSWIHQFLPSAWHRAGLAASAIAVTIAAFLVPVNQKPYPSSYTAPVNTARYGSAYIAGHEDVGAQTSLHDRVSRVVVAALATEEASSSTSSGRGEPNHIR